MNMDRLSIGQMAKLNNISEQALRLYDRKKLLEPYHVDEGTGYRYYSITQSARLDMIQYMKSCGMTLLQIKELLDRCDKEEIKALLEARYKAVDAEIETLRRSKLAIARALENYRKYEALPKGGVLFMEYIHERRICTYLSESNFFEQDYPSYEYMLRGLKKHLIGRELSGTYFCNAGTVMRKEKILSGEFYSNEFFVFVDEDYEEDQGSEIIPGGMYLCVCSDDFYEERQLAGQLLDEIEHKGFRVAGDYICEVIAEFPVFTQRRDMFYKIQIPILW